MISSADSGLLKKLESEAHDVGESPNIAWRLALHCVSLSPGSPYGKNTAEGIPLAAGSNLNPTDMSKSFQPLIVPTLFSIDF